MDIKVLTVETHLAGKVFPGTRDDIIEYMDSVGYELLDLGIGEEVRTKDDVFVKKGVEMLGKVGQVNEEKREELLPSSAQAEASCIITVKHLTPSPADFVRVSE